MIPDFSRVPLGQPGVAGGEQDWLSAVGEPEKLAWDIQANYVLRNPHALPQSGTKRPWNVRQNFFADAIDHHFDRIDEDMVFGRSADVAPIKPAARASAIA